MAEAIEVTCAVCDKEVGTGHKCKLCSEFVHLICGERDEDEEKEGYGQSVSCFKCLKIRGRGTTFRGVAKGGGDGPPQYYLCRQKLDSCRQIYCSEYY